jgi:hypothetical protein
MAGREGTELSAVEESVGVVPDQPEVGAEDHLPIFFLAF